MWPGLCVIANGGFACISAACGVTPHAQNTGTSPGANLDRVAEVRLGDVADADRGRVAEVDRCAVRAREARADLRRLHRLARRQRPHRHDHRPARTGPPGWHAMFVRYIGTFTFCSMCRTGTPAASSAFSNVNEQPITNDTRSSRQ